MFSVLVLILNEFFYTSFPDVLQKNNFFMDVKLSLTAAFFCLPFIVIQYILLSRKTLTIEKLHIVFLLNIDWFPFWYGFLLLLGMLNGEYGLLVPIKTLFIYPFYIITILFLTIKLIMYILLRIALKQEQKNSNKKLHGRVTENIDTKKKKIFKHILSIKS